MRRLVPLFGIVLSAAGPANAAVTISRSPALAPDLGKIVSGSQATTFSVSTNGVVTRTSGDAIRISTSNVTVPTVTISCILDNLDLCGLRQMRVTIQPVTSTGPASIVLFRVGSLTPGTFRDGTPVAAASMSFVLNAFGYGTATFKLGMDAKLAAQAVSGQTPFNYTVSVTLL